MELPFSHEAFLDVFGRYNTRMWPAAALLWLATAAVVWPWLRHGRLNRRVVSSLLAVHWAWSAVAYHWFYFRPINPAATLFSAVFILQAGFFTWLAATANASAGETGGLRRIIAASLVLYGLAYPVLGFAFGMEYPRLPLFAVPCPTALVTAGFLVAIAAPRFVAVVPLLWALVGSTAALSLGVKADLALGVAGLTLALNTFTPARDPRPTSCGCS